MKTSPYKIWTVLALALASGWSATAQSNNVPGPTDYDRFAQFITTRNIFNPQRYAIRPGYRPPRPDRPTYAPQFTLVGTMAYEKGMFAFFDGNQPNLRKVLYPSDTNGIVGYVVTNISTTHVTLLAPDKKETVQLNIGDSMVQEGNTWLPRLAMVGRSAYSGGGSGFDGRESFGSGDGTAPATESSSPGTSSAPSSDLQGNDVLKRLMQQRQQELK